MSRSSSIWFPAIILLLVALAPGAWAFGAGNIPSIAQVEGHNWRHGDIEDILASLAFIGRKKWTSMLIKRVYFGNWLRDYSQAVDTGALKSANAETIRILVWVLSFMSFGYATGEFEVTAERLGCYRPEEHIDNPKGYGEGIADPRQLDPRLRGPVDPVELAIDLRTGMKNYIANEDGNWATSAGYLRFSFGRCIHYGRMYTSGSNKGREEDLCEALRCLGQSLHCMEDFSAHSNYIELALREMGLRQVYPHSGTATEINVGGRTLFPLVTGTFGIVDFVHSVIGEANDHFTQSEVDQMNAALQNAEGITQNLTSNITSGGSGSRGLLDFLDNKGKGDKGPGIEFISLIGKVPGMGDGLASEARALSAASAAQEQENIRAEATNPNHVPGMSDSFDPVKVSRQIYPILEFRDKVVRSISNTVSKIPGLEKLLDHISETLTAFVMGLLAPFVRPIIKELSKSLKDGSSTVVNASADSQLETWTNPYCSDPTHSMLSKDHFTNVLNSCAGRIAVTIVKYVVPRILYAWEHPQVPIDEVVNDVIRAFHHPALRNDRVEIQREMFATVQDWYEKHPKRNALEGILSSQSVKDGHNHILASGKKKKGGHDHGHGHSHGSRSIGGGDDEDGGHGKVAGSLWAQVDTRSKDAPGVGSSWNAGPSHVRPPSSSSPYAGAAQPDFGYGGYSQPGYAPPPTDPAYGGYQQPPSQWGGAPPPGGYAAPQYPPQDYAAPQYPPQDYSAPQYPPQGYGAPQYPPQGYGAPHYPQHGHGHEHQHQHQHGHQHGHHQPPPGPPPPGWNQYGGGYGGGY